MVITLFGPRCEKTSLRHFQPSQIHPQRLPTHWVGGNRKRYQQLTNRDKKSKETMFSIAIFCQRGKKWQSEIMFLTIFGLHSSMYLRSRLPPTRCDLENRNFARSKSKVMTLSNKRITQVLTRLNGCAGWSAPLLFANPRRQVCSL